MSGGITWMGAHSNTHGSAPSPEMLGGISLTCARGVEADEFLIGLGAGLDALAVRTPCRDVTVPARDRGDRSPHVNRAVQGTCGGWVYVPEDWGAATWSTGFREVGSMRPGPGEEIVCVAWNRWGPPARIVHAPGGGRIRQADFGEDTGEGPALDAALRAAGAVFPAIGDVGEAAVAAYHEEHGPRLPAAVFTAVGEYCGLAAAQDAVAAGDLPGVLIPMV
ncbi:hypothetical protein ACF073_36625 [Streptomyces sp. NPDC015171]|uniref:hypothetical protein n=1 Tax=Streptomyces sp. NPDC015171 TaxID=3364945 RepID=UPI0036F80699